MVDKEFDNWDLSFCGMLRNVDWCYLPTFRDISLPPINTAYCPKRAKISLNLHGRFKLRHFPFLWRHSSGKYVS